MECEQNGWGRIEGEPRNIFALVIYLPHPLGKFLDDLRCELVPACKPHAHVSVLPPRSLEVDWQVASAQARTLAENWHPFQVELTNIRLFDATEVIYIEVGKGAEELRRMHDAMNAGPLGFEEPFCYCPHITLAQQIPHERVEELRAEATRRWKEYTGPRSFRAENAVFVRNIADDVWTDLAEYSLGGALAIR